MCGLHVQLMPDCCVMANITVPKDGARQAHLPHKQLLPESSAPQPALLRRITATHEMLGAGPHTYGSAPRIGNLAMRSMRSAGWPLDARPSHPTSVIL